MGVPEDNERIRMAKQTDRKRSRTRSSPEHSTPPRTQTAAPPHRRLKVFSLDPAADVQLESALISRSVLQIPWEAGLAPGPTGEYLEVVDVDPSSACLYDPVDLNAPALLAQDGLSPSTGDPQFHQQMVYAVAMKTIANFEQVLGRKMLWSERRRDENGELIQESKRRYVQRLRIYPHALRDQNAYYSPEKKALLFGYFHAPTTDPREELPGGLVFTCLSHDIVAHEMTHAILDGLHRRLLDISNPDMLAFHEAFADIVAIFQHFTMPGLLLDQIQKTRGNLRANSLLAKLAVQFARATGRGGALRNALGEIDGNGNRIPPEPGRLGRTSEPHERGAILVAAVFDAFVRMYDSRVADLRRIATGGTGVLPDGDIHPDLAQRFAEEATRLAQRVLNICIRAVDYLPPVDVTFGDYLRALVTADTDFHPDDPRRYRLAFIEAFRSHGIYPLDVRTMAEDALRWKPISSDEEMQVFRELLPPPGILATMSTAYDTRGMATLLAQIEKRQFWKDRSEAELLANADKLLRSAWTIERFQNARTDERFSLYQIERLFNRFLNGWIFGKVTRAPQKMHEQIGWQMGLDVKSALKMGTASKQEQARNSRHSDFRDPLEVHAVRPTIRLRADGRSKVELLVVLAQRRECPLLDERGTQVETSSGEKLSFVYRGGCTLIIDPETGWVNYSIGKNLCSEARKARQMEFLRSQLAEHGTVAMARFGLTEETRKSQRTLEPFALVHSHQPEKGTY